MQVECNPIFNILYSSRITYSLLFAHEVGLFTLLSNNHPGQTLEKISSDLGIHSRAMNALLKMCVNLNLLQFHDGLYSVTDITKKYLLPASPYYFGDMVSPISTFPSAYSYEAFRETIFANQPIAIITGDSSLFKETEDKPESARLLTKAMHSKSLESSTFWPKVFSFENHELMLDIGGGSGIHSINMVLQWPNMQAIVYDRPLICNVADSYVKDHKLQASVKTMHGNMWSATFPDADIHFYSDIFHDWPIEKCQFLAQKSYDSLPQGGKIIIHEILFDDSITGPYSAAIFNLMMLLLTQGEQLVQKQLHEILSKVGFKNVETVRTGLDDWSITTGVK
jgi:acetylserotonin N-methyltransferase